MEELEMNKTFSQTKGNQIANDMMKAIGVIVGGKFQSGAGKSFEETQMYQQYIVNCDTNGYSFGGDDIPERMLKSFIAATSVYLGKVKVSDPNVAAALVLTDEAGNFEFAGIVEYHENEENKDEPGNWSYVLTLNEEDLTNLENTKEVKKYLYGDDAFKVILDKVAYDIGGIEFQKDTFMYACCKILIETIIQVLDSEAVANETVDIELKGYVTFSVAVEGDEKVYAVTPDGAMKKLIKDDAALEV